MPEQTFVASGEIPRCTNTQRQTHEHVVTWPNEVAVEGECSFPIPNGVPVAEALGPSNGRHTSLEEDQEQIWRTGDTPGSSNMSQDALHAPHVAHGQPGRGNSVMTLSPRSSSASAASSVTLANLSDRDFMQRHSQTIDSSRMNQMQMLNDFLEMHFPSKEAKADLRNRLSYLMGLPEIDFSSSPMLRSAVEAICYAHAGSNYKDDRLIQASQQAYGKVLNSLVRSLNGSGDRNEPRILISSIMLLTMYDDTLPKAKATGWKAHYWGVHELLKAIGPSALSMTDPFSRLLFLNLRIPTMFLGIARRKAVILGESKWRKLGNTTGKGASSLGRLFNRALQIPRLLEQMDRFLRKNNYTDAKHIMRDLMGLRGELISWSMTEASFADKTVSHFTHVDSFNAEAFDLVIEEHLVMSSNDTFESLFDFPSMKVALDYALYWIFTLILDCALLRVMHFRPKTEAFIQPRTRAETERDATTRAKYLCRSAYFWSRLDSQGNTAFMDAQLALAESFFTETSAIKELGWCQSVRVAIQMRLKRLREKQPKTLCRLGDMVADLATSTRFKSRSIVADD